jgi:predicted dehydrogenase
MLGDASVDVVYVSTPIGLHAAHGRQVLEAGKHLWCEKPLTSRLADTRQLLELSRERGRSVCEGLMYLFHPQFQRLSEYVRDGHLGRIVSVGSAFGIPRLEHPGFRNDPILGGGALFDLGCYPVSALLALFPDADPDVAFATIGSRDAAPVDTDGQAIVRLSNGVVAHLEWRIECGYRNQIVVWGESGCVSTDLIFSKPETHVPAFTLCDAKGVCRSETGTAANHFVAMLEAFGEWSVDPGQIEDERRRIARRAQALDDIRSLAGLDVADAGV